MVQAGGPGSIPVRGYGRVLDPVSQLDLAAGALHGASVSGDSTGWGLSNGFGDGELPFRDR